MFDSSISYKRTVINSNSATIRKPCNDDCLISVTNHECGVNDLSNAVKCPVKTVNVKNQAKKAKRQRRKKVRKQWKPTGRKFSNIGYQWIPTGRKINEMCPKFAKSMPTRKWMPTGRTIPLRNEHTLNRSNTDTCTASISDDSIVSTSDVGVPITVTNQMEPILAWGSQLSSYPFLSVFNCRSFKSFCGTWTQAFPSI